MYIIGKIRTDRDLTLPELFFDKFAQIDLHDILPDDADILKFGERLGKDGFQAAVEFHSDNLLGFQRKLLCQDAEARTDLQHAAFRRGNSVFRDSRTDLRINQEVLSQSL